MKSHPTVRVVALNADNYQGMGMTYVDRLALGVMKHMKPCPDFKAFTVSHKTTRLKGWWNKMILFNPQMFNKGDRIIFFDLDTIIKGPIGRLAEYSGPFAMLRDFYYPETVGSGVMMWEAGHPIPVEIWEKYESAGFPQEDSGGDQAFIRSLNLKIDRIQDFFHGLFASFKVHGNPKEASVICFHGHPKPHELPEDHELRRVWNGKN